MSGHKLEADALESEAREIRALLPEAIAIHEELVRVIVYARQGRLERAERHLAFVRELVVRWAAVEQAKLDGLELVGS